MGYTEYDLDDDTNTKLSLVIVRNVANISEVKKKLLDGKLKCAIVNPLLIVDPFQILVAANKAVLNEKLGQLTTKNIYTELVYNLSPTSKITQSLVQFGIDEKLNDLLVCVLNGKEDENVLSQISGVISPITCLNELTDISLVKKTYKISDLETKATNILDSIVTRISVKDVC